jgi:DNA polymerase-1
MEGDGPVTADLMILDGSPGETEDELNLPLVGQAGTYLRDELMVHASIPESNVRFSHVVRCHTPKSRTPTSLELKKCRRFLTEEIKRVKPKVIVGLGNAPLATLLQRFYKGANEEGTARKSDPIVSGILTWQGKKIWLREFDCWFIPTFHPSTCLMSESKRSYYKTDLVVKDLKLALELSKSSRYQQSDISTTVVSTAKQAITCISKMVACGKFAFDIETGINEEDPAKPHIIGCSFANNGLHGYYIPWNMVKANRQVNYAMRSMLKNTKLIKLMHNGAYEVRVMRFNGILIYDKYFDTMISAHMIDENFTKRLKDLTWIHTDFGGYDIPLEKYKYDNHIKADYAKIPYEMLSVYGAMDSVATWIIYEHTTAQMAKENLLPLFNKVSMPVRRVMSDAEYVGIYVDKDRAVAVDTHCTISMALLEKEIYEIAGGEFNIGSSPKLQDILYKKLKFDPLKKIKTGYSTDKDSIEYIATQPNSEIAQYLSDLSYVKTMQGTHISQAIQFRWPSDGRIHAHYNSTGTVTGRVSCSSPSLQNVPADRLVRSIYTATPGNYLIEADLKSAELAAIAAVSGETTFLEAFANGLDPHSQTYRRMYNLPDSYQPTKLERRKAKTINFGLVYGITSIGLARSLGCTIEEAQAFMNLYFERLPHIHKWMESQKRFVKKHGYVISVFNRKRRLPMGLSDSWFDQGRAERQAMNAPIQSSAADYTYIGLIRLARLLKKGKLESKIVHTVHDCGLVDTIPSEKELVLEAFYEAFETPVKAMPVKMKVDVEVNRRWGENNESRLEEIFEKVGLSTIAA